MSKYTLHTMWPRVKQTLRTSRFQNGAIVLEVLLIVGLVVFNVVIHPPKVVKLATTHQPERLTELYFPNSQNLPASYVPSQSLPVTFSIHNIEYRHMSYQYQISLVIGTSTDIIKTGVVAVANNQTATLHFNPIIPLSPNRLEVRVALINVHEMIHFWVERVAAS